MRPHLSFNSWHHLSATLRIYQCRQHAAQSSRNAGSLTLRRCHQSHTAHLPALKTQLTTILLGCGPHALCYLLTSGSLSAPPPLRLPPAACPPSTSASEGALPTTQRHHMLSEPDMTSPEPCQHSLRVDFSYMHSQACTSWNDLDCVVLLLSNAQLFASKQPLGPTGGARAQHSLCIMEPEERLARAKTGMHRHGGGRSTRL